MARRRGFFAELQYQNQLAERQRAQAERAQARAYAAAVREAERAQRQAEQAAAATQRATVAETKAAEREAERLFVEARVAEVDALNTELAEITDELESVLSATLTVDDFVDLQTLRVSATHPPFARTDLEVPTPAPQPIRAPAEPVFVEPEGRSGLRGMFASKQHDQAVAQARATFDAAYLQWQTEVAAIPLRELERTQQRNAVEQRRMRELEAARAAYYHECRARETEAVTANEKLEGLMYRFVSSEHAAIQEYVGIVLSNSVYPELLSVEHDYEFDPGTRELTLSALIAAPDRLPAEKVYRYVKARDEITSTPLSKKVLKDRYAGIVHQVALRTLHEIFEADRAKHVQTIALQVAAETTDPATGLPRRIAFVAVAAERDSFMAINLQGIVPLATLEYLGAAISKSPFDLVGIDEAPGVRRQ